MKPSELKTPLSERLVREVEEKMNHTIKGIENTLREILRSGEVSFNDVKSILKTLKPSFSLLSQRWVLEILYSLLIIGSLSFNNLKKLTGANSRSLSSKLKALVELGYVHREVKIGPPLRTKYSLTKRGKEVALLSLPILYYIAKSSHNIHPKTLRST